MSYAPNVLVIDDESEQLEPLVSSLRTALGESVGVRQWQPVADEDPLTHFDTEVEAGLALVVTDQDLTKSRLGLLGSSVTSWAQDRFIPVCNFSRKPERRLPRERNFFELRIPPEPDENARAAFVARIYSGFDEIRRYVSGVEDGRPTAQLLAGAMGVQEIADDVAPFLASVASVSSSLLQTLAKKDGRPSEPERVDVLTFILGHVLINAVLEFPGPILSRATLAAYCAVSEAMSGHLADLFREAAYNGPFSSPGKYFERRMVDRKIDSLADEFDEVPEEPDQYARAVVTRELGSVQPHGCVRCRGTRGGYWCPFTRRAVCNRPDCSVPSNTWIPRGATLCRVEHDYFEELSPLLGE